MTFEEWMRKRVGHPPYSGVYREIWDAATKQERERCAKIADTFRRRPVTARDQGRNEVARAIVAALKDREHLITYEDGSAAYPSGGEFPKTEPQ